MHLLRRLVPHVEVADGAVRIMRGHRVADSIRIGPNHVHAVVIHPDDKLKKVAQSKGWRIIPE